MPNLMQERQAYHGDDELDRAVGEAVDQVLAGVPAELRAEALRSLRMELERCLAEAPVNGPVVNSIAIRARMAAALAGHCRRS
jgi:hypothetical protein